MVYVFIYLFILFKAIRHKICKLLLLTTTILILIIILWCHSLLKARPINFVLISKDINYINH
jgi:hypothetical protein